MKVLVVGGAGYIGSHMVKALLARRVDVTVLDSLVTGFRDAVVGGAFVQADLADRAGLEAVLGQGGFDAVMHFASFIQVGESVREPAKYYRNNVVNTLNLLDAMVERGVRRLIFSSSAAVYGEPQYTPIDERHPKQPVNPYGISKWVVEQALADYGRAYGVKSVSLRYFNAAGADPDAELGERHQPETHLIPLVLQAASGRRAAIQVYGRDYPTRDGTCIRDYIHVSDLCEAHWLALQALMDGAGSGAYNLGTGDGYSIQEVLDSAARVVGRPIPAADAPRREGDPAVLVADATQAMKDLGWRPRYGELETLLRHAWAWEQKLARLG